MPGETCAHARLKQLALTFLREGGCGAAACEVSGPIPRWRLDVAGWVDRVRPGHALAVAFAGSFVGAPGSRPRADLSLWRCRPQTVIIECKQSRQDFRRDCGEQVALLARRLDLHRFRQSIERHCIAAHEKNLRLAGSSLFSELDAWDYGKCTRRSYRTVLQEIKLVDRKLREQVKFHLLARYALADRLYLAAPRGLIAPSEVPQGWGLLECGADTMDALQVTIPAPCGESSDQRRARLLRNIAIAASGAAYRSVGINPSC